MFGRKTFADTLTFSARLTKRTRKSNRNMEKACSKLSLAISGCLKEKLWTNLGIFFFNLHFFFHNNKPKNTNSIAKYKRKTFTIVYCDKYQFNLKKQQQTTIKSKNKKKKEKKLKK